MAKQQQEWREEEVKNRVAKGLFEGYDCSKIISNVDFTVARQHEDTLLPYMDQFFLWAEAKRGTTANIYHSLVQLILTIGRNRSQTIDLYLPPKYLGAFDAEKIAFIPYSSIIDVLYLNDFNWQVTPSDHSTKEFGTLLNLVQEILDNSLSIYQYERDEKELKAFIKQNFKKEGDEHQRAVITGTNFIHIYQRWREQVMPSIAIDWKGAKKSGIIAADFFLADLISKDSGTLAENLYVVLAHDHYVTARQISQIGLEFSAKVTFKDDQKAYHQFWNHYERPPKKEYWEYIITRRDLLVPQDIRERKGSFFTPPQWVELSQEYIARVLGEQWQDEYYIWDCCAGTGNLLAGLTNKYHIYASTLDQQDVDVMRERIQKMNAEATREGTNDKGSGSNLLDAHVFQFDFLNDPFTKLPQSLQDIINNPETRKKLVIYINPPYAETAKKKLAEKGRKNKRGVSFTTVRERYSDLIGIATKELYAQFLIRASEELKGCIIAEFSKLKALLGQNFTAYRQAYKWQLRSGFIVPSTTFDNVKGSFPIGFKIWDTTQERENDVFTLDVYNEKAEYAGKKTMSVPGMTLTDFFNKNKTWVERTIHKNSIGALALYGCDFQHSNYIAIYPVNKAPNRWTYLTRYNLVPACIYLAVRHCIAPTWINDRDQFLYPQNSWRGDSEFHGDCLTYTLFHPQNTITHKEHTNHWIPFKETEVNARERFGSHFMTDFIDGKLPEDENKTRSLFETEEDITYPTGTTAIQFSPEAQIVFESGRKLWQYYHQQPDANPNASYYDIREFFQGRDANGRMNATSEDETYNALVGNLRQAVKYLGDHKITPKVYRHKFLLSDLPITS